MKKIPLRFDVQNKRLTIAIIGYGRFGQLLTKIFLEYSDTHIMVISSKEQTRNHERLSFVEPDKIASADLIIPCVPISAFEKIIRKIAPILKDSAVVMDICSVKILPVRIMKKYLPKNVQAIACHPMFGPDSFRINKGLRNLRLVLNNVTASKLIYSNIKFFFKQLGINVLELSPQKHDQLLAWSLGYSYLIGKIGQRLKLKETPIDTYDFKLLLQNIKIISNDSEKLFMDMQVYNPFANKIRNEFIEVAEKILNEIRLSGILLNKLDSSSIEKIPLRKSENANKTIEKLKKLLKDA